MKTKTTFTLFLCVSAFLNSFSQEKKLIEINGKIIANGKPVSNVHIINKTSKTGTISNDEGNFTMLVLLNDYLLFSSVQYEVKTIKITKNHINNKTLNIEIKPLVNILDEVFLHGLNGSLTTDISKTPIDTIPKMNFKYHKYDSYKFKSPDVVNYKKPPSTIGMVDPAYVGESAIATLPDYRLIREQRLKATLKKKKIFSQTLITELGIDFFIKDLKIHKDSINLFIDFCENENLFSAYEDNKKLKVIEILTLQRKKFYELNN